MKNIDKTFILFSSVLKNFDFTSEDIQDYIDHCNTLGIDMSEDFIDIKHTLYQILAEIEKAELKSRAKKKVEIANEFQLYKVSDAAKKSCISEPELRKAIRQGRITTINVTGGNRGTRISLEEIRNFAA